MTEYILTQYLEERIAHIYTRQLHKVTLLKKYVSNSKRIERGFIAFVYHYFDSYNFSSASVNFSFINSRGSGFQSLMSQNLTAIIVTSCGSVDETNNHAVLRHNTMMKVIFFSFEYDNELNNRIVEKLVRNGSRVL